MTSLPLRVFGILFAFTLAGCPRTSPTPPPPPEVTETASVAAPAAAPAAPPPGVKTAGQPCVGGGECAAGLHCTTADGACDKPPGCEPGDICPTLCYGVCARDEAATSGGCRTDADCAAVAHYCDGCHCLARPARAPDPDCDGKTVACVADPCTGQRPQCLEGTCRLVEADAE